MHVKKGDKVIVLSGKDKGAEGAIVRAFPKRDMIIVEGVNVVKRHKRAGGRGGKKGQIIDKTMPIHVSNVAKK
jgi:large subunit ribosomal protein L24